jgi:DNA-binding MarR family transcriptional regulator
MKRFVVQCFAEERLAGETLVRGGQFETVKEQSKNQAARTRHDLEVLGSIRKIIHAFDVYSRRLTRQYGITAPQLVCLLEVIEQDGITAREIASRIHLGPSTLVGVLDRLESKGLIERRRDTRDRRKV